MQKIILMDKDYNIEKFKVYLRVKPGPEKEKSSKKQIIFENKSVFFIYIKVLLKGAYPEDNNVT